MLFAVASTILKTTSLALANTGVQFAEGPDVLPRHDAAYWAEATRGFDFSGEDRVPADIYNKILWEGLKGTRAPVPHSRFQMIAAANKEAKVADKDDDK